MKTNKQIAINNLNLVIEKINEDRLHEAERILSTVRDDIRKAIADRKAFERSLWTRKFR
jgi:vacuolar-type H+-ATPase subunit E/Vma4